MAFRSNRGHIAGEDVSAYVDAELSASETARVYAHLQTCGECRALADDLRATQTAMRSLPLARAPRDFTLGPEFDVAPSRQPSYAPKRGWFNFMPAVAMSAALLVMLVFVDVSSLGGSTSDDASGGQASAPASLSAQDAAKGAAESAAPQPPPVAPRQSQPGSGSGGTTPQGFGPTPLPQAAAAPPAAVTPSTLMAPAPPLATPGAPLIAPAIASPPPAVTGAVQAPTPTGNIEALGRDAAVDEKDDDGIDTLRLLEIIAAVVLIGSLVGLYLQRRREPSP
jgi:hypothetical protein